MQRQALNNFKLDHDRSIQAQLIKMLCLRCSQGFSAALRPSSFSQAAARTALKASSKRTFTSFLGPSRPTVLPSSFTIKPSLSGSIPAPAISASAETLDLLPKISTHPALGATQIRCGPRNTFSPSHFVRKRRHGFLSRIRTRKGRMTLARRRAKKRSTLSH
ncbi:related to ribosomal protein L34, mitochondrial [Phialocephala subalpina]|uniref:Large ribosomal subunit protein bL34m n=1 Tax=Phialocephala subalpina TaxID=576137 RepID=A0A1L7WYS6_9HELO|nr:related to ribosomal protein L34, mitochondrial [Phialocephala subalpina]